MRRLDVQRGTCSLTADDAVREQDYATLIRQPTAIYENGKVAAIYDFMPSGAEDLRAALLQAPCAPSARTNGYKTVTANVGFMPPFQLYQRKLCATAGMHSRTPDAHTLVCSYAETVNDYYRQAAPDRHLQHALNVAHIERSWRLEGTVFTSGIINRDYSIFYHRDRGNVPGCWSAMVAFKRGCDGGYLSLPEWNIGVEMADHSLFLFDGRILTHGVTPIYPQEPDWHRFTLVFYSLAEMWRCEPIGG